MVQIISSKDKPAIAKLKERNYEGLDMAAERVLPIIRDIRAQGDKALFFYTKKFDNIELYRHNVKVSKEEIKSARAKVPEKTVKAMRISAANIRRYAQMKMPKEWKKAIAKGIVAGQLVRPIDTVGCYVPSGNFPLPSTLLMTVVTAKVAGVKNVIVCTPPRENNAAIYVASEIAEADDVYKIGGAQAIAAMAYGTESVPKVKKIVGPGNIFVTAAKKLVYGDVDIDFIAGPTEIIIYSEKGNPKFIVADMLAQAEHDRLAMAMLITPNKNLAEQVSAELEVQLNILSTKVTAMESIRNYGAIIIADTIKEAAEIINDFAPEHLEIMDRQEKLLPLIRNAGAIFLGQYSPEAAGDYATGPNHVLPTRGFAASRAGLSVLDFIKMPSVQELSKLGLASIRETITTIAEAEGLEGHKKSVEARFENDKT